MCSSEEVTERIIQEVDERCCIEVRITHHLAGKESLSGATSEQASHHPVAHVHVMSHFLQSEGIHYLGILNLLLKKQSGPMVDGL